MKIDTSKNGLEALIVAQMTGQPASAHAGPGMSEAPQQPFVDLHTWLLGNPQDYDRAFR